LRLCLCSTAARAALLGSAQHHAVHCSSAKAAGCDALQRQNGLIIIMLPIKP
jgi:hypothetical protein